MCFIQNDSAGGKKHELSSESIRIPSATSFLLLQKVRGPAIQIRKRPRFPANRCLKPGGTPLFGLALTHPFR